MCLHSQETYNFAHTCAQVLRTSYVYGNNNNNRSSELDCSYWSRVVNRSARSSEKRDGSRVVLPRCFIAVVQRERAKKIKCLQDVHTYTWI